MSPVTEWLTRNGLEPHAEAFEREGITLESLATVSDDDLERLGVTSADARKRLRDAARARDVVGAPVVPGRTPWAWALRLVAALLLAIGAYALYLSLREGAVVWRTGNAGSFINDEHRASALLALLGVLATALGLFSAAPAPARRLLQRLRSRTSTTEPQMRIGAALSVLTAIAVFCGIGTYGALALKRVVNQIDHDEVRAKNAKYKREQHDGDDGTTASARDVLARTASGRRPSTSAEEAPTYDDAAAAPAAPAAPRVDTLVPTAITASSSLPPTSLGGVYYTFEAENLMDGRLDTSWQPLRNGSVRSVRVNYETSRLTEVRLANGFQSNDVNGDMYASNRRVARLTLATSSGWMQVIDVADERGFQVLPVRDPGDSDWVELRIDETHDDARWPDVAISEIQLAGVRDGGSNPFEAPSAYEAPPAAPVALPAVEAAPAAPRAAYAAPPAAPAAPTPRGGNFGYKGEGGTGTIGGDAIILGALDKALIDAVVTRNMAQIRYCYQQQLSKDATLGGKITIKFVIAKDGTVSSASTKSTTMNNAAVEGCIAGRFLKFQFPEPKGGGIVMVSYPFLFSPN